MTKLEQLIKRRETISDNKLSMIQSCSHVTDIARVLTESWDEVAEDVNCTQNDLNLITDSAQIILDFAKNIDKLSWDEIPYLEEDYRKKITDNFDTVINELDKQINEEEKNLQIDWTDNATKEEILSQLALKSEEELRELLQNQ